MAGVTRLTIALSHWQMAGSGLLLLGGLISVAVGIGLWATLPWSGLWVLGTLIAIELMFQGAAWFEFGFGLRRLGQVTP